jgi:hypothetical protein
MKELSTTLYLESLSEENLSFTNNIFETKVVIFQCSSLHISSNVGKKLNTCFTKHLHINYIHIFVSVVQYN